MTEQPVERRDEEMVRAALRRLNPEFHKFDASWPALDRMVAELNRLREECELGRKTLATMDQWHEEAVAQLASLVAHTADLRRQARDIARAALAEERT